MAKWRRPVRPFLSRAQLFHLDPASEQRRALPPTRFDRPADLRIVELLLAARDGQFARVGEVIPLMQQHDDDLFWGEASTLLSFAAPSSVLHDLVRAFSQPVFVDRDPVVQGWIAETLLNSGLLWTVPEALRILAAQDDRSEMFAIPARLSFLLEPDLGPIFEGPARVPEPGDFPAWYERDFTYDDLPYVDLVQRDYEGKLAVASHGELTAFAFGREVDLEALAHDTLNGIGKAEDNERVAITRTILEAYTGVDLVAFYGDNAVLDRSGAAQALEAMFDAVDLGAFTRGRRFFFGRQVPD